MTKRRQTSAQHLLSNPFGTLFRTQRLELLNEVRHIVNGPEVASAIERHVRGNKKVLDRKRVQCRHVPGNHIGARRAMVDLDRSHSFEDGSLMLVSDGPV